MFGFLVVSLAFTALFYIWGMMLLYFIEGKENHILFPFEAVPANTEVNPKGGFTFTDRDCSRNFLPEIISA